jgi:hypothetical protein
LAQEALKKSSAMRRRGEVDDEVYDEVSTKLF